MWWTSRLRGRRFAQLLQQARQVTQQRISLGAIERGRPGRREAMPYFLAVLRQLAERGDTTGAWRGAPFPRRPLPQCLRHPILRSLAITQKAATLIDMHRQNP